MYCLFEAADLVKKLFLITVNSICNNLLRDMVISFAVATNCLYINLTCDGSPTYLRLVLSFSSGPNDTITFRNLAKIRTFEK